MTLRHPIRIPGITELPPSGAGMRIGLFGGSFNPIHEGHRLVVEETLRRLELDALWVLVTPGNPLKNHNDLAPLADRVAGGARSCSTIRASASPVSRRRTASPIPGRPSAS